MNLVDPEDGEEREEEAAVTLGVREGPPGVTGLAGDFACAEEDGGFTGGAWARRFERDEEEDEVAAGVAGEVVPLREEDEEEDEECCERLELLEEAEDEEDAAGTA